MKKIAIITSLDYEIFGDGTGNVQREQIIPTEHIANIYDLYYAKLTVMFEYGQYVAYKKYADNNNQLLKDNQHIEKQLIDLVKKGHDVQLHYHAQWHNAIYDTQTNSFKIDLKHVDITSLKYEEIIQVLKEGKVFLEKLLKPYNPNYKCVGFRSGSWAVSDEAKLLSALKECGFKADSSVVPNVRFESEQVHFEYTNCPHHYHYWYTNGLLSQNGNLTRNNDDFVEIPPYTKKNKCAFLKYLNPKYLLSKKIVSSFYTTKISEKNFSIFQKIKKVLTRNYYMADFNTMTYDTLLNMIEEVLNDNSFDEEIIPVMFIAHPKTSYNIDDLHLMFCVLDEKYKNRVEYWTYQEAIEYLISENKK